MKALADLTRWTSHRLDLPDFSDLWPFNPSIAVSPDGELVLSARYANYHLPGSKAQATRDKPGPVVNYVMLAKLDRETLQVADPTHARFVGLPSTLSTQWNASLGLEDLRLVYAHRSDGTSALCATASAMRTLHLRHARAINGDPVMPELAPGVLEIVVAVFADDAVDELRAGGDPRITRIVPMRGAWSTGHQKNWSPFVLPPGEPRAGRAPFCLYSPLGGGVHCVGDNGASLRGVPTHDPPTLASLAASDGKPYQPRVMPQQSFRSGSINVQIRSHVHAKAAPERLALRGGTQLVQIADGLGPWSDNWETCTSEPSSRSRWIGLAHGCEVGAEKYYWHRFYEVDSMGDLLGLSEPFKLSPAHGIEFAAGLAQVANAGGLASDPRRRELFASRSAGIRRDGDRYVISFGVEDDSSWIGSVPIEDVHAIVKPLASRA